MAVYFGNAQTWMRRAEDGSFPSWWDGIYVLDEKIADYVVAETDNGWTGVNGEFYNDGFKYRAFLEHVDIHPQEVGIYVEGADVHRWEVGIDVRYIYSNHSHYVCQLDTHTLRAELEKGSIDISLNGKILEVRERVHSPIHPQNGAKPTRIFAVDVEGVNPLILRISRTPRRHPTQSKRANTGFESGSRLDKLYTAARRTLDILRARMGFYAGLPWFTQYWARDFLWSVPALLREGYIKEVREGILALAYNMREGEVPRLIRERGEPEFGSIDANPLFIHAVYVFSRTVDPGIINVLRRALIEAWDFIHTIMEGDKLVSRGEDTWMDTLKGRRYPIDVIGLWYRAALDMERMGLGKGFSSFVKSVYESNAVLYTMERTPNILVAAICGLVSPHHALRFLQENRLVKEGIRTLSPMEIEYDPEGYHTGSAWGLTTGWGLYVSAMARDWNLFWRLVDVLLKRGRYLDECWNSETGKKIGADVQLWSGAMVIRTIDEVIVDSKILPRGVNKITRVRWGNEGLQRISFRRHV